MYKQEMLEELKKGIFDRNTDKTFFEFACNEDKIIWKETRKRNDLDY